MKKTLYIILFLLVSINLYSQSVYFVQDTAYNANASDSNAGTDIDYPWATWQKALVTAQAGDTVYFRGGVWYPEARIKKDPDNTQLYGASGYNGTYDAPIVYMAYPPDVAEGDIPILDCINHTTLSSFDQGMQFFGTYQKLIGPMEIRHVKEKVYNQEIRGIEFGNGSLGGNVWLERIVSHDHGGYGFLMNGFDTLYITNCDAYNCVDSISDHPGNRSDGFGGGSGGTAVDTFKVAYFTGCRSWHNSDNAFDLAAGFQLYVEDCWAWSCGYLEEGAGGHFKFAGSAVRDMTKRVVKNTISAFATGAGYVTENLYYPNYGPVMSFYNNTSYKDQIAFQDANECDDDPDWGWTQSLTTGRCVFRNNIAYQTRGNNGFNVYGATFAAWCYQYPQHITQDHNNWEQFGDYYATQVNADYTITDDDFTSVDSVTIVTQLSAPRKDDGSLPDITVLKLAPGSDLIDGGVNVGLPYSGTAPDLGYSEFAPIIADHTVVDRFDDIPQYYIDKVKEMRFVIAGESHALGYGRGLERLEVDYPQFVVNYQYNPGSPEAYTTSRLRADLYTWGDVTHATGWIWGYGEEDWFTSAAAIAQTKVGLSYTNNTVYEPYAFGFGWCYDGAIIDATDYIEATKEYIDYCADSIDTKIYYTTGPVDLMYDEIGYNKYLMYEQIRDSVSADPSRMLFDFADILYYDDSGDYSTEPYTVTWDGHTYPVGTPTNVEDDFGAHMSWEAAVRLAKGVWWMLARMAGWDGLSVSAPSESDATDITAFSFTEQTGAATINTTNHTISIEVAYGTSLTSLSPSITVSYGASIDPPGGTARNFTSPVTYTVMAEDGTTTQVWTVTVTVEDLPIGHAAKTGNRIMLHNGEPVRL